MNNQIRAAKLRLIDEDGQQIGVVSLEDAMRLAYDNGLDVVEIGPHAEPVVCKLADYKKFRYELAKKQRQDRKHAKEVGLKEVRFGPFIGEHDLLVRVNQIREFLSQGERVKITIRFRGRQMAHPEFGSQVTQKILTHLGENHVVEQESRFEGRQYITVILPKKG